MADGVGRDQAAPEEPAGNEQNQHPFYKTGNAAAPVVNGAKYGQMGHQVQGAADKEPGDQQGEESGGKDSDPGNLDGHKVGQGLNGVGYNFGDAVIHGLLEGLRIAFEQPGVLQRLQKFV